MTDELCARKGCGFPKAWHSRESTIEDLYDWDNGGVLPSISLYRAGTACLAVDSICAAYLAPEPPKPKRKPYVVEMTEEQRDSYREASTGIAAWLNQHFLPLDEYQAAHPQPTPALCICGHSHGAACKGEWRWLTKRGAEMWRTCHCKQYQAVQP